MSHRKTTISLITLFWFHARKLKQLRVQAFVQCPLTVSFCKMFLLQILFHMWLEMSLGCYQDTRKHRVTTSTLIPWEMG